MFRVNFTENKTDGLFIDKNGQLRVNSQPEVFSKSVWEGIAPKQLFKLCSGLIVLLCNAFLFLVLYYYLILSVPLQYQNLPQAYYTMGAILASLTCGLSLLFYILYKVYESRLEVTQVLIEVERFRD